MNEAVAAHSNLFPVFIVLALFGGFIAWWIYKHKDRALAIEQSVLDKLHPSAVKANGPAVAATPPPVAPVLTGDHVVDIMQAHADSIATAVQATAQAVSQAVKANAPPAQPVAAAPRWEPESIIEKGGDTTSLFADWQNAGRPGVTARGNPVDTTGWPLINGFRLGTPATQLVDHRDDPAFDFADTASGRRFSNIPGVGNASKALTVVDYTGPISLEVTRLGGNAANSVQLKVTRDGVPVLDRPVATVSDKPSFPASPGAYVVSVTGAEPFDVMINHRKE